MNEFHFLRPYWFAALLPALWLLILLWRHRSRGGDWQRLVAPALLSHLLLEAGQTLRRLPLLMLGLGWLLAVVALAGPTWQRQPQPVFRAAIDRVLVLDMSPSMAATDLKPDRLSQTRYAIRDLLAAASEGRTALVVFGGEPHVVTPLTDDRATIEALLPALSVDIMPQPGNRAAPALRTAGDLLQRVGSRNGTVLLLSDGVDDTADSLAAVRALRKDGYRVSVLGTGTLSGAPVAAPGGGFAQGADGAVQLARLDERGLQALASAGGGHYLRIGSGSPDTLIEQQAGHDLAHALSDTHGMDRWVEQGPWLLLPLLLLAAAGFRRGWLGVLVVLLVPPPPAHAFGWQDLWLRSDQQASHLLQQGDAKAAAERFRDPHWRATARYQSGDYAGAAREFAGAAPDSAYNRGNALARAGQLQQALAAYDSALKQRPGDADARFNRDLVENLLHRQQQQSQSSPQSGASKNSQSGQGSQPGKSGQGTQQGQSGQGSQPGKSGQGSQQGNSGQDTQQGQSGQGSQQGKAGQGAQQGSAGKDAQSGKTAQAAQQNPAAKSAGNGDRQGQATAGASPGQSKPDADDKVAAGQQALPAGNGQPKSADEKAQANAAGANAAAAQSQDEQDRIAQQAQAASSSGVAQSGAQAQDRRATVSPPDSAAQARADVSPTSNPAAHAAAGERPAPKTEQDIAMEQWLRQVPDDPAGLLRRKFMLEHLLRQKGQPTP
jgi:Ca-activated chloride channel homolog